MAEEKDLKNLETVEDETLAEQKARERKNMEEMTDLQATQTGESVALNAYNKAQYANMGEILNDVQSKIDAAKQKDETALRRENAYRYISGLGDTLSGVANLVGTTQGASNQNQTYNSHAVVQKAEEARKARKIEMDDLNTRLDEMKARQNELKTSGSLAEAQLKAQHDRERMALKNQQDADAREAEYKRRMLAVDEMNARTSRMNAEKERNTTSTSKSRIVKVQGADGKMSDFDVSGYKDFDKAYQKALDAAIVAGTSGLTEDEIKAYKSAVGLAKADSNKALNEFLRSHTYRQNIIDQMNNITSITNKYQ